MGYLQKVWNFLCKHTKFYQVENQWSSSLTFFLTNSNSLFSYAQILAKHSQILVKFDESFAFGDKQDVFEELCNKSASIPELIIGEIQTSGW